MTVRRRLALSMAALLLLSGASAVLSIGARQRTTTALAELQAGQHRLEQLLALDRELHLRWRELSVIRELSPTGAQLEVLGARLDAVDRLVEQLAPEPHASVVSSAYRAASTTWRATLADLQRGPTTAEMQPPAMALDALLAWRVQEQRRAAEASARFTATLAAANRVTMILLVGSLVVGTAIVVGLSLTVTAGLARLDNASRHVAAGDYSCRVPLGTANDEFVRVSRTFNDMAAALAVSVEETQAARARAEAASAAKSCFLTSLSHDLKTPLTAILGYADVIEDDVRRAGLTTPAADVAQLRRSARVLLGMVGELLDYARLEVGRMPVALSAADPATLVDDVAGALRPLLEQRGNRFVLTDLRTGRPIVTTDHGKLRHILLNLLGNACKFTSGGQVEVVLRESAVPPLLLIEVRDSGIGMDDAECARVFAPYVQANSEIVQRFGGSGLGLAISKQFAELLGGDIAVHSSPGAGSCFVLALPARPADQVECLALADFEEAAALFASLDAPPAPHLDA